jgi:DNA-binding IclR family transcriptional regulator
MPTPDTKFNAIEKTLEVLLSFDRDKPLWGVRELSQHLSFSPATVQRILQTLKAYGFVVQDNRSRQYSLGNVFYGFYHALDTRSRMAGTARKYMALVGEATRETVHLNIVQGTDRICIDTLESTRNLRAGMPIGNLSPLYAGASAKCLLAFSSKAFQDHYFRTTIFDSLTDNTITDPVSLKEELEAIRSRGYAISLGERTPGLGSVSSPILDHSGSVVSGLSLAIPEIRFRDREHLDACIRVLVEASRSCSLDLGYNPGPEPDSGAGLRGRIPEAISTAGRDESGEGK